MCASAAAPGRGTEKGGYRGHLMECPVSAVRRERRISPPWLKSVTAVEGNNVPAPTKGASPPSYRKPLCPWATVFSSIFLEQQFSQITASVHPTRYLEVSREARRSALLPFSARATFHPDCTVGTGFSPVRPLLQAGVSSGVLASCPDAKIRMILCLPARVVRGL